MKKIPTKADMRALLERETESFLKCGGKVEEIPRGISGREGNQPLPLPTRTLFTEPSIERTPVPEVVAAIEARRANKARPSTARQRKGRQRYRKTLYDDFGEPLRRIWVDE